MACKTNSECTAFTYMDDMRYCDFLYCPIPVPEPAGDMEIYMSFVEQGKNKNTYYKHILTIYH